MASRAERKQRLRERLAAEQAAAEAQARRGRALRIGAVVVALALVVVGGIWWQTNRSALTVPDSGLPAVAAEQVDAGIALGTAAAPVVDVYVDFLCPHCAEMEERIGPAVAELAESGDARVVLHPVSYIDPEESARAAGALACAVGTEQVLAYQAAMLANQGGGFGADRLVEIATAVGIDDAEVEQCIRDEGEAGWAADVDAAARDLGVAGTPTVFVDGVEMPIEATETPETFLAAVEELAG